MSIIRISRLLLITILLADFTTFAKKSNLPPSLQRLIGRNQSQKSPPMSVQKIMVSKSRGHKLMSNNNPNRTPSLLQHDDSGLECYTCNDEADCKFSWKKIRNNPSNTDFIKKCSTPKEKCMLHYSTFVDDATTIPGPMRIVLAGCKTPDPSQKLDPSGCVSTPVTTTSNEGEPWTGTHGMKTCYCGENKCNDNVLECSRCSDDPTDDKYQNCSTPTSTTGHKNSDEAVFAKHCFISAGSLSDEGFIADIENYAFSILTPPCPTNVVTMTKEIDKWEKDDGTLRFAKCSCSTSLCNKIVVELVKYFSKPKPTCQICPADGCKGSYTSASPSTRRRGDVCYSKYVKDDTLGKFLFAEYGSRELPEGEVLFPPTTHPQQDDEEEEVPYECRKNYTDGGKTTRKCYCDGVQNPGCNVLHCVTCWSGTNDCGRAEQCEEGVAQECWIGYDDSAIPARVEGGCRDLYMVKRLIKDDPDPVCGDEEDLEDWIGSADKYACRCEGTKCNEMVRVLLPDSGGGSERKRRKRKGAIGGSRDLKGFSWGVTLALFLSFYYQIIVTQ